MIDIPNKLEEYGISPVIGVILMVAITVTLAAIVGLFAVELSESQSQNAQAGVSMEETENGVKIRLQESQPSLERLEILVNGTEVDGATLDQVGESVTVTSPEDGSITVRGVTNNGNESIIRETTASEDTTGGENPKVVSGGTPTPASTSTPPSTVSNPNSTAPVCAEDAQYEGSGTRSDPYVISNDYDLQCIKQDLDAHYVLGNDIDASGTSNWNGGGFKPIGSSSNPFTGTFDGNKNEIQSLTLATNSSNEAGMLGYVDYTSTSGGVNNWHIQDVKLTDVSVADPSNTDRAGSIAIDIKNAFVSQVSISGEIKAKDYVGGMASGFSTSTENQGIYNSRVSADVRALSETGSLFGTSTGGFVASGIAHYEDSIFVGTSTSAESGSDTNSYQDLENGGDGSYSTSFTNAYAEESSSDDHRPDVTVLTNSEITGSNAKDNLSGLDFSDTWKTTDGYPKLQWED